MNQNFKNIYTYSKSYEIKQNCLMQYWISYHQRNTG